MAAVQTKIERIRRKLQNSIEQGKFYEAGQQAKTIHYRYKAQGNRQGAVKILYESVILFLDYGQLEIGIDLARLMVDYLKDSKATALTSCELELLVSIIKKCKRNSTSREDFIKECLGLTLSGFKHGHPVIHLAAAIKYWEECSFSDARRHFLFASDGVSFASFVVEYQVKYGLAGEVDLFAAQTVLQFLCLSDSNSARVFFVTYTANHPAIKRRSWPFPYPLLNFIAFLLLAVEAGSTKQFNVLCQQYKPTLSRDPLYFEYLEKIGDLFFGIKPQEAPKPGITGMLGGLMESLLGGNADLNEMATEDVD